ncbi:TIGR02611 family protein [Streptomyces hirsutus]
MTADRAGMDRADQASDERALGSRAPAFVKARRTLHLSWQVGVFVVGFAVVMAGAAMLLPPGRAGWCLGRHGDLGDRVRLGPVGAPVDQAQGHRGGAARTRSPGAAPERGPTPVALVIGTALAGIYLWKFGLVMPWEIENQ